MRYYMLINIYIYIYIYIFIVIFLRVMKIICVFVMFTRGRLGSFYIWSGEFVTFTRCVGS